MAFSNIKKLLQVTEEAAPALHIPFMVGNELFVLTQQDVRRIEDIRFLSYSRLDANRPIYNNLTTETTGNNSASPTVIQDLISHSLPQTQETCNLGITTQQNIANISNQLNWAKHSRDTLTYPLSYSKTTSTCALHEPKHVHASQQCCPLCHTGCQANPETKSQACNTEPPTKESSSEASKIPKQQSNGKRSSNGSLLDVRFCESQASVNSEASTITPEHQPAEKRVSFECPWATDDSPRHCTLCNEKTTQTDVVEK